MLTVCYINVGRPRAGLRFSAPRRDFATIRIAGRDCCPPPLLTPRPALDVPILTKARVARISVNVPASSSLSLTQPEVPRVEEIRDATGI